MSQPYDDSELSELQRDALMETFNIGVGRASKALSHLFSCDIALSAPILVPVRAANVATLIDPAMRGSDDVCAVTRAITGVDAEVVMIVQGDTKSIAALPSAQLVRDGLDVRSDPRADAVSKLGYLVISSCVDQMEEVVGRRFERHPLRFMPSLPEKIVGAARPSDEMLYGVKIAIIMSAKGVASYLLFSFTRDAANRLAAGLDRIIAESAEGDAGHA